MKYQVIVGKRFEREARAAALYIEEHANAYVALRWYLGLQDAISSLSVFPYRCPIARESSNFPGATMRQTYYHSHRIVFQIDGETVYVLRLRHMAQGDSL